MGELQRMRSDCKRDLQLFASEGAERAESLDLFWGFPVWGVLTLGSQILLTWGSSSFYFGDKLATICSAWLPKFLFIYHVRYFLALSPVSPSRPVPPLMRSTSVHYAGGALLSTYMDDRLGICFFYFSGRKSPFSQPSLVAERHKGNKGFSASKLLGHEELAHRNGNPVCTG